MEKLGRFRLEKRSCDSEQEVVPDVSSPYPWVSRLLVHNNVFHDFNHCQAILISGTHLITSSDCLAFTQKGERLPVEFQGEYGAFTVYARRMIRKVDGTAIISNVALIELSESIHSEVPKLDFKNRSCDQFPEIESPQGITFFNSTTARVYPLDFNITCVASPAYAAELVEPVSQQNPGSPLLSFVDEEPVVSGVWSVFDPAQCSSRGISYYASLGVNKKFIDQFLAITETESGERTTRTLWPNEWVKLDDGTKEEPSVMSGAPSDSTDSNSAFPTSGASYAEYGTYTLFLAVFILTLFV
ncbi:hypothetical protein [Endozoicomonas arenosclerae]|uniref:hypothetical protein n=1 Tax=Endozoicomonas arenosclerae TaxID=1633495 RepID=UPI0007829561|nr:hypothetical protein [Endozoicomonas arenosclerae]